MATAELARVFGVSSSTIKNWRKKKIIKPRVEIGSVVRFDVDECAQRLEGCGRRPT